MASWDPDAETSALVDFRLAVRSFVTMFWKMPVLDETLDWLRVHDYDVVEFDTATWASSVDMVDDMARRLSFPSHSGQNLDALNDCLRDVAAGHYGWRPDAAGLVIVLRAFDRFTAIERTTAQHVLDILANQAHSAILIGNRILCLVQSDDPALDFEPVGAMPVVWNDVEWLKSQRGI